MRKITVLLVIILAKGYSNDREKINVVNYGKCDVYIPKHHKIGSLGSPWWKQLLTGKDEPLSILDRITLPESDYWKNIKAAIDKLEKGERTALVFIHGFNVSFDEATLRAAQLGVDLKIPLTAFYSWPSKGDILDYAADTASVEASEQYIEDFLIKFAKNSGADSINIIAHSMGNRALLRAVQNAKAEAKVPFNQIFLAAPDIDSGTFQQIADKYLNISKRTTLYCSSKDKALELSGELYKYPRAGHIPPVTIVDGIDTVEVSSVDFSRLGHGYYAAARSVLQDMHDAIIHNTPPENRFGLWRVKTTEGVYWTFEP